METMTVLKKRQSCRSFTKDQITEDELTTILKAGNAAPVGMKRYEDIKITIIQNKNLTNKIDEATVKLFKRPGYHPTFDAPTIILVSGNRLEGSQSGIPYCNAACIVENMIIAATDFRIGSCYLMGIVVAIADDEELCADLNIPEGFIPCAALALGYPAKELGDRALTTDNFAVEYIR